MENRDMETWRHGDMEKWRHREMGWRHGHGDIKQKTEAQAIFLHQFTFCSSCKREFVLCPFVDEEINGSCPLVNGVIGLTGLNGLNGLNGLALWFFL